MKKIKFIVVFSVIAILLCFSVFAVSKSFSISVPKAYTYAYSDESKSEIAEKLNMTDKEITDYFKQNHIEFFALNGDNTEQIRVCVYEDDFSKEVGDFSVLSNDGLVSVAKKMIEGTNLNYSVCSNKGINYIKLFETLKDSGGEYTATEFVTVSGGKVYNISFNNSGTSFKEDFYKTLDSFKITGKTAILKTTVILTVAVAVGIALFAAVIAFMIFGIVKDKNKTDKE